jgi:hypothetical protein
MGICKPKLEKNINKSLKKEKQVIEKHGSVGKYLDNTGVDCKVMKNKEIYISAEGIVLPCCWLAGQMYKWYIPANSAQIWEFIDKDRLNINTRSLKDILNDESFNNIMDSWDLPSVEQGKSKVCAMKCGFELDQFGDQFK